MRKGKERHGKERKGKERKGNVPKHIEVKDNSNQSTLKCCKSDKTTTMSNTNDEDKDRDKP